MKLIMVALSLSILGFLARVPVNAQHDAVFTLHEFAKIKESLYDVSDDHNYALVSDFVQKYKQDKAVRSLMIAAIDELLHDAKQLGLATSVSILAGSAAFYLWNMHKYALGVLLLIIAITPSRSYKVALRPLQFYKHCTRLKKIRTLCYYKAFQDMKNSYCKGAYEHF